jgi:hypothetical protein
VSGHALLSASGAHKWLHCCPSARLEQTYADHESEAAAEGTAAHALAEYKLKTALNQQAERPKSQYETDEMNVCTEDYVEFVLESIAQAKLLCRDPIVLIEQHLDFSCYVPDGFGTGDVVIVGDGVLHIIDFKYGRGVLVGAAENPQMMLYALGALQQFGNLYDMNQACMTIFQPRRENVSTWSIPISELLTWADSILKPRAVLAYDGRGDFCPGDWCTFCKAAVKCRARAESKLSLAKYEFALPPLLTDEEIEDILLRVDDLNRWANDIIGYATDAAVNHGKTWRGFKLVESRSMRRFLNEEAVAQASQAAGYPDIYRQSMIPLIDMERLMGKEQFGAILGRFVVKPPGKPTLVPASDRRQTMNSSNAQQEFKEDIEHG